MAIHSHFSKFFNQKEITFQDIDIFFGNAFTLRNISNHTEEAFLKLLKIKELSNFKYIIDKLYTSSKNPLSLAAFCHEKLPNKKEKLIYLLNNQKLSLSRDSIDFVFFFSLYSRENEISKYMLENVYNNDLSELRDRHYHSIFSRFFIMNNDYITKYFSEHKYKFSYDDLSFLPQDHILGAKIIDILISNNQLDFSQPFVMNIDEEFHNFISNNQINKLNINNMLNNTNINVSRPDIKITLPVLLIKKGYPVKIIEQYLQHNNKDFICSDKNFLNVREHYHYDKGNLIRKTSHDIDKWAYWIQKYPNQFIDEQQTLFSLALFSLTNINELVSITKPNKTEIKEKLANIVNKVLQQNPNDLIVNENQEPLFEKNDVMHLLKSDNLNLKETFLNNELFNKYDSEKNIPYFLFQRLSELKDSRNNLILTHNGFVHSEEKEAKSSIEIKQHEHILSLYLSKTSQINNIKYFEFTEKLIESAMSNFFIDKSVFFTNSIISYFEIYSKRNAMNKPDYNIEILLNHIEKNIDTDLLTPLLDDILINLSVYFEKDEKFNGNLDKFLNFRENKYIVAKKKNNNIKQKRL